ncbi:hypothetical protein ATANTOWER_026703 [Ataeniobius toweri]|uniref:Uncharacterized protein n=1 Tax=Ataeniobius toweri TaxID=208326 RepID=A0ABU7A3D8_9TELE|nr:hypothetical protein [Ataeniobius toweri]
MHARSEDESHLKVKIMKAKVPVVSLSPAVPCSLHCVRFSAFGAVRRQAERRSADIVIKSTTAHVSSLHSPLICQPCSNGHLCEYMQNRWIRPLHTLPLNFRLFHTLQDPKINTHTPTISLCILSHSRDPQKQLQVAHSPVPQMI